MSVDGIRDYHQRGFAARMGFGERPALIVIDFTCAFTDPDSPFGTMVDEEVRQTNRLIDAARNTSAPIVFTAIAYDQPDFDAGLWIRKIPGLEVLKTGTRAVEQDPRLHRTSEDPVIVKHHASCFFGTDLASRLQTRRVDTLILAGCSTSGCVRATAVDACASGYRTIVAREAVADRSKAAHRQSLVDIEAKYGDVVGVEEVLAFLERHRQLVG